MYRSDCQRGKRARPNRAKNGANRSGVPTTMPRSATTISGARWREFCDENQRRARDSNPHPLTGHLISNQAASHSRTLRNRLNNLSTAFLPGKVLFSTTTTVRSPKVTCFPATFNLITATCNASGTFHLVYHRRLPNMNKS